MSFFLVDSQVIYGYLNRKVLLSKDKNVLNLSHKTIVREIIVKQLLKKDKLEILRTMHTIRQFELKMTEIFKQKIKRGEPIEGQKRLKTR